MSVCFPAMPAGGCATDCPTPSLQILPELHPLHSLPCLQVDAPRTAQSPTPPAQYPQGRCPCAAGLPGAFARQPQAPAHATRGTAGPTAAAALLATPARGRAASPQVGQQAPCRCLSQPGQIYRALLQQCCVHARLHVIASTVPPSVVIARPMPVGAAVSQGRCAAVLWRLPGLFVIAGSMQRAALVARCFKGSCHAAGKSMSPSAMYWQPDSQPCLCR